MQHRNCGYSLCILLCLEVYQSIACSSILRPKLLTEPYHTHRSTHLQRKYRLFLLRLLCHSPHANRLIIAAGSNEQAIGRPGCTPNSLGVSLQGSQFFARLAIPHLHQPTLARSCQQDSHPGTTSQDMPSQHPGALVGHDSLCWLYPIAILCRHRSLWPAPVQRETTLLHWAAHSE